MPLTAEHGWPRFAWHPAGVDLRELKHHAISRPVPGPAMYCGVLASQARLRTRAHKFTALIQADRP
ncbi:MAG TPA: hypothetical protein VF951_00115, partial [Streptosporangiaceae bacterium]